MEDDAAGTCTDTSQDIILKEEDEKSNSDLGENQDEKETNNVTDDPESPPLTTMSKRQRKRLEHKMKKKMFLKERRQEEREKKKKRLREAKAQGLDTGPSRKALKLNTMAKSSCKVSVAIDCSFDHLMTDKDIKSIVKQVNFCYASNRRVRDPVQFHITSFNKRLKQIMDGIGQHQYWDVHLHEESYEDIFSKDQIVYLSSDSTNILNSLDDSKVYIIGGLVDHNHHKGVCLKLAEEKGYAHAQLPIGDYITLESRKVLAINHVFDILLRFTENPDWKDAFHKVIPQRKILGPKDHEKGCVATGNSAASVDNSAHTDSDHTNESGGEEQEEIHKLTQTDLDNKRKSCDEIVNVEESKITDCSTVDNR